MKKTYIYVCATVVLCTKLLAQQPSQTSPPLQQLHEVVVSDSRFELKRENSGKTVIKITAEELERSQGRTIAEIINTKSGIEIAGSRGRDGDVLGIFARGGRGRQALVLIDGVRVSDPSSFSPEYDLRLLSPAAIASIEIIKGAASTLYGTNAATVVINITTKKSTEQKIAGDFQSSIGTYQTAEDQNYNLGHFSNAAWVNGTLDRFTYAVTFASRHNSGLSAAVTPENEEDIFSQYSADVTLGYQASEAFAVTVYGNHTQFTNEFDADRAEAPNRSETDQRRVGVSSSITHKKGAVHLNTAYTAYTTDTENTFGSSVFEGNNVVVDAYTKYVLASRWHTLLGINYIRDEAVLSEAVDFTIVDPYANVVYVSDFGLNLNLGARLNTHSEYGSHGVYNFNPSYTFTTPKGYVKVLGSYASSYITPTLLQLFGEFGSPDLEPEENRTLEGGVEYAVGKKIRLSALYFHRDEKNTIGFNQNFVSINLAEEIDVQGVELEAFWKPVNTVTIAANYTFTERQGDEAIRIPKHKANVALAYQPSSRTHLSLNYAYTGTRVDTDFSTFTTVPLDAFSLVQLYVEHALIPNMFKVFVNGDNLLNAEYTEIIGFTTRGRNFRMGMALRF